MILEAKSRLRMKVAIKTEAELAGERIAKNILREVRILESNERELPQISTIESIKKALLAELSDLPEGDKDDSKGRLRDRENRAAGYEKTIFG